MIAAAKMTFGFLIGGPLRWLALLTTAVAVLNLADPFLEVRVNPIADLMLSHYAMWWEGPVSAFLEGVNSALAAAALPGISAPAALFSVIVLLLILALYEIGGALTEGDDGVNGQSALATFYMFLHLFAATSFLLLAPFLITTIAPFPDFIGRWCELEIFVQNTIAALFAITLIAGIRNVCGRARRFLPGRVVPPASAPVRRAGELALAMLFVALLAAAPAW